ncbi:unnamed protein product [Urochloa decumbens]|uniref:F-box domain-containing protein n=1 Tax=Urochloa decumbens TaxID=240449 RepID=A0ABC9BXX5_9POAL
MEVRDWTALPRDILLDIFFLLGPLEVMMGAEFVCTAWRRAALKEPTLWRRVNRDLHYTRCRLVWDVLHHRWRRRISDNTETAMRFAALDRAAGQCKAFAGTCDDKKLHHLVARAPYLKSLHVEHYCDKSSCEALVEALRNLTLLKNLRVSWTYVSHKRDTEDLLQSVCQACPHLKKLRIWYNKECGCVGTIDVGQIPMMHELRYLQLYDVDLSCYALESILDRCPVLETLDIRGFFNKREMNSELHMKCARLKDLCLLTRSRRHNIIDYYFRGDGYFVEEYTDSEEEC